MLSAFRVITAAGVCLLAGAGSAVAQYDDRYLGDPIRYSDAPADNPVSRLADGLADGSVSLERDRDHGYLPAVLAALAIPVESQVLVFSKTSLQVDFISPVTPRAIYFNDDVYVGAILGSGMLEISTADPNLGAVFYTVSTQRPAPGIRVDREVHGCLQCHAGALTRGIPGHVIRSVPTSDTGLPMLSAGAYITTQESPFNERWGGWYVTGTHGSQRHMGNVFAIRDGERVLVDRAAGANRETLPAVVAADRYLAPHSDIVALMVLEHQARMHNLITEAAFAARQALFDQAVMDDILDRPKGELSASTQRRIASAGNRLVDHMLFVAEAELTDPVSGTSGFAEVFMAQGPRDSQGRSLRDLNLETRLFEYPLSYLIYSPQFDGLPEPMKDYVYRRLWDILTGVIDTKAYLHLTNAVTRRIRDIVVETKPGLPGYWYEPAG